MTEFELRKQYVDVARSYLGVKEGSAKHHEIVDIYNSHKPLARGYALKYTDAWCAGYVSAMAIKAGLTDIIPTEVGCGKMIELFKKLGRWIEDDIHIPKIGDVIFYDWDDSGKGDNAGSPDHVGIVEKVVNGVIYVIEGNYDNAVGIREISVNGKHIRGFGVPDFSSMAEPVRFEDVDPGAWYAAEVARAAELGIVKGVGDNLFAPNEPATRAEVAAMMVRLYDLIKG